MYYGSWSSCRWCGLLVSLFIIYNGIKSFADTARRVMGEGTDENAAKSLREYITAFDGGFFKNVYDIQIIDYGFELRQAIKKEGISAAAKEIRVNRSDEKLQVIFLAEIPFEDAKKETEITEKLKHILRDDRYEIIPKLLLGHSAKMTNNHEFKGRHNKEETKEIMNYSDTTYPFLEDDCVQLFGSEKGSKIFGEAEKLLLSYQDGADYRNSEAIRFHMQRKIFPLIAYYKTLRANGFDENTAIDYARQESAKVAAEKKKDFEKLAKLPFAYGFYRLGVKSHMNKNFPAEGWDIEWACINGKEIHFDMKSCIYHDLAVEKGCPELCTVFCDNDDISFSGLLPKIVFKRENTIGYGGKRCDFHFIKSKK